MPTVAGFVTPWAHDEIFCAKSDLEWKRVIAAQSRYKGDLSSGRAVSLMVVMASAREEFFPAVPAHRAERPAHVRRVWPLPGGGAEHRLARLRLGFLPQRLQRGHLYPRQRGGPPGTSGSWCLPWPARTATPWRWPAGSAGWQGRRGRHAATAAPVLPRSAPPCTATA
jgi:hypothetical protein